MSYRLSYSTKVIGETWEEEETRPFIEEEG